MTINLHTDSAGVFDVFGRVFHAAETIQAGVVASHVDLQDVVTQYENCPDNVELNAIVATVEAAKQAFDGLDGVGRLRDLTQSYLTELVRQDTHPISSSVLGAVAELITQMRNDDQSLEASVIGWEYGYTGTGNGVLAVSTKRPDGLQQQFIFNEEVAFEATDDNGTSMTVEGHEAVSILAANWPQGSGARTVLSVTIGGGLIANGTFEAVSVEDDAMPDGWLMVTGTPGIHCYLTTPETQTVTIAGTPTAGYYLLSWVGPDDIRRTTGAISYNASASLVQASLRELPGLESVEVTATGTSPNLTHSVRFVGQGGDVGLLTAVNRMSGASAVNEQQRIALSNTDGGTFTVSFGGSTTGPIAYDATSSEVDAALEALGNIASGDLTCAGGPLPGSPVTVTFGGTLAGTNQPAMTIDDSGLTRTAPSIAVSESTAGVGPTNEVQTLTITSATGGTYTLTFNGQTTSSLAYNANAAAIQTALRALSTIGSGNVNVSGSGPFTITFAGTLAATNVNPITVNTASLTPSGIGTGYVIEAWKLEEQPGENRVGEVSSIALVEQTGDVATNSGADGVDALIDSNLAWLESATSAALKPTGSARSLVAWFKMPTGATSADAAIKWITASGHGVLAFVSATDSTVRARGVSSAGTTFGTTQSITLDAWHLVIVQWDGSNLGISVDGGSFVENSLSGSMATDNYKVVLSGPAGFEIDDVALFDVALADGHASALWNSGTGVFYPYSGVGGASAAVATTTQGDPGTNEVQLLTPVMSPNAGTFTLTHSTVESDPIAYNASASALQTILNDMGIATFAVSGSAGGPWSVTFGGSLAAQNVALFTADSSGLSNAQPSGTVTTLVNGSPDSGSITITETVAGDAEVYMGGYSLVLESDGSTQTTLTQKLSLQALEQYALNAVLRVSASCTGTMQFALVDGVDGDVISDDQGTQNSYSLDMSQVQDNAWRHLTSFGWESVTFRTPSKMPSMVYLRIKLTTPPADGVKVFVDNVAMVAMTRFYAGGPSLALFGGSVPFRLGDAYSCGFYNGREGRLHEWMNRCFDLAANELLLPVAIAGSGDETIPDSVIQ